MKMLTLFVTLCLSAMALAVDAVDANQTLSFEMSEEEIPWKESEALGYPGMTPVWAVGVAIEGETPDLWEFLPSPSVGHSRSHFRSFVITRDVSEQQKILLEGQYAGLVVTPHVRIGPDGTGHRQQLLLAVSVKDAKMMAQAYLDYAMQNYAELLVGYERQKEKTLEGIAKAKASLPLLIEEANGLQGEYDSLRQSTPYESKNETLNAVAALNTLLNTISVEISGIRSKIGAIQAYQADKRVNASVQIHLEDMLVEQSIGLKAAQARQETATSLRDQARRYATLKTSLPELQASIERTKRKIPSSRDYLEKVDKLLRQAIPPHIIDNVATLYRIIDSSKPSLYEIEEPEN